MTILWDFNPDAHHTYRYALGDSPEVMSHGPSILKAAENGAGHRMVVIGADIDIESACQLAERLRARACSRPPEPMRRMFMAGPPR